MKKFKLFLSLAKEEEWINSIQEEGYKLVAINTFFHIYTFKRLCDKEHYIPYVRLDFREKSMRKDIYDEYLTLFSDSGWGLIKGSRFGGVQYFQQERSDVTRDIFSDIDSKENVRKRYTKFSCSYGFLFIFYSYIFIKNMSGWGNHLLNFKTWYLTPNLWNLKGFSFLFSFLFETPFVFLRIFLPFSFLFLGVYYLIRSVVNGRETSSIR